jgi:hypothetical protein
MKKTREQIVFDILRKRYPGAREDFLCVVVEAISLHEKKNTDYNGVKSIIPTELFGVNGKVYDIGRKFTRLFHLIVEGQDMKVQEEILYDTAIDLGVYAFLLATYFKTTAKGKKS